MTQGSSSYSAASASLINLHQSVLIICHFVTPTTQRYTFYRSVIFTCNIPMLLTRCLSQKTSLKSKPRGKKIITINNTQACGASNNLNSCLEILHIRPRSRNIVKHATAISQMCLQQLKGSPESTTFGQYPCCWRPNYNYFIICQDKSILLYSGS